MSSIVEKLNDALAWDWLHGYAGLLIAVFYHTVKLYLPHILLYCEIF